MIILFYLFLLTSCSKVICITKNDYLNDTICNRSNTIANIDESEDISEKIMQYFSLLDTDIYLFSKSDTIIRFQLRIFNYKQIFFDTRSAVINVSRSHGIDATFYFGTIRFIGPSLKDDQTSFFISYTTIISEVNEIRIKDLSIVGKWEIYAKKFTVNSFYLSRFCHVDVKLTNDIMFIKEHYDMNWTKINFAGENTSFAINMSENYQYEQYNLTIENKGTDINFFDFRSIKNIIFNGDGYKTHNVMKFSRCCTIISNVDCLCFAPFYIHTWCSLTLYISKSLVIKGEIQYSHTSPFIINTTMPYTNSRLSVEIESIRNDFKIFIMKSWIDLTFNHIRDCRSYIIEPCVGYGGSSSATILDGPLMDMRESSISVFVDLTISYPTDEYLSLLLSKKWTAIQFKSSETYLFNENHYLSFHPQYIHGFKSYYFKEYDTNSILDFKFISTSDGYALEFIPFSYSTIPSYLCYTDSNDVSNGKPFNDLSLLNDLIPIDQKVIHLVIDKKETDLDISIIKARNLTFNIKTTDLGSLKSLKMDADNINHLILDTVKFDSEVFQLNVKKITFNNITVPPSNLISDEKTVIDSDLTSMLNLDKLECTFPLTRVIIEKYGNLFGYKPNFYFDLYDNSINISADEYSYSISTISIPKIEFQFWGYYNTKNLHIYNNATSLKSISFIPLNEDSNINVYLHNFESIVKADNINIDISNFTQKKEFYFYGFVWKDWFTIKGNDYKIVNEYIYKENYFCVCNDDESCTKYCSESMTNVSYSELTEKVKVLTDGAVQIYVVGNGDESEVPLLNLNYVDHKNVYIFGTGTNPKIKIDSSSQFVDAEKLISMSHITVLFDTSKESIYISNLHINEDCIINETFNKISLVSDFLNVSFLRLSFKTIHINKHLIVYGDARKTESETKVTFSPHAKFNIRLPYLFTLNDCLLIIKQIEFNLTQVVPLFWIEDKRPYPLDKEILLTIYAINANLDVVDDNITFDFIPQHVRVIGNFVNENPSKFIIFSSYSKALYLQAENIPFIMTLSRITCVLEKEKVSIAGRIAFISNYNLIYSSIDEQTVIYVKDVFIDYDIDTTLFFNSTKTQLNIGNLSSTNDNYNKFIFNLLVDLNNHNLVQIINQVNCEYKIAYKVQLLVPGDIYDPNILDFIKTNQTLLILNELNSLNSSYVDEIKFLSNIMGFVNDNFKLVADKNKLLLTTIQSPMISLRYGNCSSCFETEITDDDVNNIEKFYINTNPVISVTFYESNSPDFCLDFDKSDIKVQSLTLKSTELLTSYIKISKSLPELYAENIDIAFQDSGDFSIQKAKLVKSAKFNNAMDYNRLNSLQIDQESLFISGITEHANKIDITVDSLCEINFTSTGVKLVNSELQAFNIDSSKFPQVNLIIDSDESPILNLEEGVSEINQLNSLVFNTSNFRIGSGWNQTKSKVEFTIQNEDNKNVSVISESFPFYSWYFMFDHPINLSSKLSPFTFIEESLILYDKNISINAPDNETITIGTVILSDNCSIKTNNTLMINNLTVINGTSTHNHSIIKDEITLGQESILISNFSINENINVLNIEWDLQQAPIIDFPVKQEITPKRINIIYKGSEVEGRERQFDKFLTEGVLLINNVNNTELLNNIHFISDTVSEFNDGDKLMLKCIYSYYDRILLISTKVFIEEYDEFEYPTSPIEEVTPTEIPTKGDEPIIGDSFQSMSSIIELTEDGFIDGENFVKVDDDDNSNIKFISTNQKSLTLKAKNNDTPNKELFVSPSNSDTTITISPPSDESNDYGKSMFGIHANSKNPTVNLHSEKVPLNIFNNEKSDVNFNLIQKQKSLNSKISLQNLIISNGDLKLIVPNEIDGIEFNKVESFLNGNVESINIDQKSTEIYIEALKLNSGSSIKMSTIYFNKTIELKSNSKIEIERKVTFNEQSIIQIDESSFIEFGKSEINGIVNKIRINQIRTKRMIDFIKNAVSSEIICGENFECNEWKEKFETNSFYKYSHCNKKQNGEMCLVVSNKEQQPKKKKLSAGEIAAIVVSVCVVVVAISIVTIFLVKKKKNNSESQEEDNSGVDDYV